MKKSVVLICVMLAARALFADVYSEALRQARGVAGQGNNNPPGNNRPPPPPPAAPAPPAENPALQATLKNISNLRADFDALGGLVELKPDSPPKKMLLKDLTEAAQGPKPSKDSVAQLADKLAVAVVGNKDLSAQHEKLARDVHAIFNSSHLSAQQQQMVFTDIQNTLQTGGVTADQTTNVVSAVQTIASETQ